MASAAAAAEAAAAATAPGAKRGDTALLHVELGEATEPGQVDSASATAAARAPALVGADSEGAAPYAWRGSMVRQASERGRSSPKSALPPPPSSAEPLLLAGMPRAPVGCGSGGRLGGASVGVGPAAAAAAAAMAASRPGLDVSARLAFKSSRLANSWCSGMRFSCTPTEGDRMPVPVLLGDSAPLPMPRGEAAASRPAAGRVSSPEQQSEAQS